MDLEHARKMRDGLLKGDSVMAQAWKELLSDDKSSPIFEGGEEIVGHDHPEGKRAVQRFTQKEGAF